MHRSALLLLVVSLSISLQSAAQGRPSNPGNPAIDPPQTIVDSTGKVVGDVLKIEGAGLASASVKYMLPDSGHVILSINGQSIRAISQNANPEVFPEQASVYFKEADCSGDAYLRFYGSSGAGHQLTRRQALMISQILLPPPPQPSMSCPEPHGSQWLFAADLPSFTCPVVADAQTSITFNAYWGFAMNNPGGSMNLCSPARVTFGGPNPASPVMSRASFVPYKRYEDLMARFKAPFYIP